MVGDSGVMGQRARTTRSSRDDACPGGMKLIDEVAAQNRYHMFDIGLLILQRPCIQGKVP